MAENYFRTWFVDNSATMDQRSLPRGTSALNEFVRSLGTDVDNPEVWKTMRDVLEFSLSANERDRQSIVVSMGSDRQGKKIKLSWRDVGQGVVAVCLLGKDANPIVRLQATRCLADLAESPKHQVTMASYSAVLDVLMSQLQNGYGVSPGVSGREQIFLADVLMTQILKASCSSLQEQTARCLANLAQKQENHMQMASSSVLDPLVELLKSDAQPQVHQQAARCLTNLAGSTQNKDRIANYPGLLSALVALLGKQASSAVHKQIINCLTNLASSQKIQIKIVSNYPVVLNALVRFLGEKGNTDVQQESLKCLTSLSDHYQSTQIDIASHPGILDAILRLLRANWITTDRIKVQVEAIRCLLKLLSAPENLLKIASHDGALHVLVICLDPRCRNRKVRNLAVECLSSLAAAPENQLKMVKSPTLVSALVAAVTKSDGNGKPVEKSDGEENQVAEEAQISEGQELAAWCLSKLAIAKETKKPLTFCRGLLRLLVTLLKRPNQALLEPALKCLVNLAQSDEFSVKTKITNHDGVIDALVILLGSNLEANLLEHTAQCLSDLALSPLNARKIVAHPKVLESLVKLLEYNANSGVLEYTTKCLNNLACLEESQLKMASFPGMLNALVLSLSLRVELTQGIHEQVVKCLTQLSDPPENQSKIRDFPGIHNALLRMAADNAQPKSQIRQAALQCLVNLRLNPVAESQPKFNRHGSTARSSQQCSSGRKLDDSISDPDHWSMDPIMYETMCDPVKCNDGRTYDRWTIIKHGIRKSPYDRSLKRFFIACDDLDVRRRLFRDFPDQEVKFRQLRENYREKALQSAHALNFEDAIEMLNNVLMWASSDTECRTELDKVLTLVNEPSSSLHTQSQEILVNEGSSSRDTQHQGRILTLAGERSSALDTESQDRLLVYPEGPHHNQGVPSETDLEFSSASASLMEEDQTSRTPILGLQDVMTVRGIPLLIHDDLVRVRAEEGSRKALVWILFGFALYFAIFIGI